MDCHYCHGAAIVRVRSVTATSPDPDWVALCARHAGVVLGQVPTNALDVTLEVQPLPKRTT